MPETSATLHWAIVRTFHGHAGGAPLLSLTAKNHQGPTHERGSTTGIQIKFQIVGACHATTEKAGDSLAEITHKAEISHNAVPNYHLTKEAPRCPERSRTPLRPLLTLGTSVHATQQSQCLRPAPTGPGPISKCAIFSPSKPHSQLLGGFEAESVRNTTQRRRFPRSAKPTANNPSRKPHRSPGPMAKSAPISCETAQKSRGRDRRQGRSNRQRQHGRNRR